jgi:hypothetical protein
VLLSRLLSLLCLASARSWWAAHARPPCRRGHLLRLPVIHKCPPLPFLLPILQTTRNMWTLRAARAAKTKGQRAATTKRHRRWGGLLRLPCYIRAGLGSQHAFQHHHSEDRRDQQQQNRSPRLGQGRHPPLLLFPCFMQSARPRSQRKAAGAASQKLRVEHDSDDDEVDSQEEQEDSGAGGGCLGWQQRHAGPRFIQK